MCYYAMTDYKCGDWKWGNMKLRCPRQHRMGETCGARLVHHESVIKIADTCRLCQEIGTKQRRLQRERENIARWSREGSKFAASIEKAQRESRQLEETIRELWNRRPSVQLKHNTDQTNNVGGVVSATNSHTYSVTSGQPSGRHSAYSTSNRR